AQLKQTVWVLDFIQGEPVVEDTFLTSVRHLHDLADVAGTIELGSYLADFRRQIFIVINEPVRSHGSSGWTSRYGQRKSTGTEQGHTRTVDLTQLVDFSGFDQLQGFDNLLRRDPVRSTGLIVLAPLRVGPPRPFVSRLRERVVRYQQQGD